MNKVASVKHTFIKSHESVSSIRADLIIALIPSVLWAVIRYGANALILLAASVISSVAADVILTYISESKFKLPAVYTYFCAMIFALTLYSQTSVVIAVTGSILCVFLVKVMGGEGASFIFAPIAARILIFEMLPYSVGMTTEMPLEVLQSGELPSESIFDLMLGMESGSVGTVSVIAILIGFVYLALRRHTDFKASVAFVAVSFALSFFLPSFEGRGMESAAFELLSGEAVFTAVFVLTDYASSPFGDLGKIIKGIICAVIMFLMRKLGYAAESVFLAVFCTNLITYAVSTVYSRAKEVKNAK